MAIRNATADDIDGMVDLAESFRARLAHYSTVFWRPAPDANERQSTWFRMLLGFEDVIALLDDDGSALRGFIVGRLTVAPPVYAPGGPVCLIDDFCVGSDGQWATTGHALVEAIETQARSRGAVLLVVICAHHDAAKRAFLGTTRFAVTAEWHVRGLE